SGAPISPYNGTVVTVQGVITVPRGTYDAATHYVQDCSGGIQFATTTGPTAQLGDVVTVTGTVSSFLGEIRISPVSQLTINGPGQLPSISTHGPGIGKSLEAVGTLTAFRGMAGGPVTNFRFPLVSRLGGGPGVDTVVVFIDPDTGIPSTMIQSGAS